jgi:hypothetical protein
VNYRAPDSKPVHNRGARSSESLPLLTAPTAACPTVAICHVGVLEPGPELVQLNALLGSAEWPGELSAPCDERAEPHFDAQVFPFHDGLFELLARLCAFS